MDSAESLSFARFLKFWRKTFGYSQEALSAEVGISTRHLSFLETGRSKPSRQLVIDFATFFKLSGRDTNNLLVAADFLPQDSSTLAHTEGENSYLGKMLDLALNNLDNTPACIQDGYGNVVQCNREWIVFNRYWNTGFLDGSCVNTYHLYCSERGIRPYLKDWENIASALLLNFQQEILFTDNKQAQQALDDLLALDDIPSDWQHRGANTSYNHSIKLELSAPGKDTQHYVVTNNTIGATHYVSEPRLLITCLNRIDAKFESDYFIGEDIYHPLMERYKQV